MEENKPKQIKCRYNLTDRCVKIGNKIDFRGLCCRPCMSAKNQIYYETHKDNSFQRYHKKNMNIKQ